MGTDITGRIRAGFIRRTLTRRRLFHVWRLVTLPMFAFAVSFGFLMGSRSSAEDYDPHLFATGVSTLLAAACGVMALLLYLNRMRRGEIKRLRTENEALADRNWELKEAEERAKSFVETQGDLIVRRDPDGRITFANDSFCTLAGRARVMLAGSAFSLPVLEQGDTATLADGTRAHDQKLDTPCGARWIAWRDVTVHSGDGRTEVQSVGRDVTDRVEAERALAEARDAADGANRAKSRFLAMVSHEIRTPLNGILGMADLLLETPLTPEQMTYTKAVRTSGDTLLSLIGEILDFSKIEAGRLDLEARPFALTALIEEVVELLAPRAQAKGIEIASYVDERLPERVTGDAVRLRQVLLNLAGNAVKFTEHGGVAVIAEPGLWPNEIILLVRDTGIGIASEQQERIFQEFEQIDSGSARRFGGTGLGLSISKRIVERMGGKISVESALGAGATFTLSLPLEPADAPEPGFVPPALDDMAVLIVAPNSVEASLLSLRLMRWGAQTCVVPDESVALALLPERAWDTMIVDQAIGLPAMTRLIDAAADVRRRMVLIMPGTRHELPALRDAGFTSYLVKPVRAGTLAARLAAAPEAFGALAPASADAAASPERPAAGLTILVAEDNEINALLARALLAKLGHRPTVATSGTAALDSWHAAREAGTPYDLVLMDVHMPGTDGLEACRRIRAAEGGGDGAGHTPVLALTANAFAEDRDACLAAGMDGFLVKPLDPDRLATALAGVSARPPLAA